MHKGAYKKERARKVAQEVGTLEVFETHLEVEVAVVGSRSSAIKVKKQKEKQHKISRSK